MLSWRRQGWVRRGLSRRLVGALLGLVLALSLVASLTHAGGRYFYCEAMGLLPSDPCRSAPAAEDDASSTTNVLGEQRRDCCEVITLRSLPDAATRIVPSVPPAGVVAVVPAVGPQLAADARGSRAQRYASSAPPRPPDKLRAHVFNQVFLT